MPRYKLRIPSAGAALYGDDGTAIVADTIEDAREFWEDYDGEPAIYLSSYIGRCRVVYKRDLDCGACHEDAEPGDTTVGYLRDDGRDLRDNEVRVWERGGPPVDWLGERLPREPVHPREIPVGCRVAHPVLGHGETTAPAYEWRRSGGWRVPVAFQKPGGPWHILGSSVQMSVFSLILLGKGHGGYGTWPPPPPQRLIVEGEHVADVKGEAAFDALLSVRLTRLRAEWEREQFDLYLAEHEKTAHA